MGVGSRLAEGSIPRAGVHFFASLLIKNRSRGGGGGGAVGKMARRAEVRAATLSACPWSIIRLAQEERKSTARSLASEGIAPPQTCNYVSVMAEENENYSCERRTGFGIIDAN